MPTVQSALPKAIDSDATHRPRKLLVEQRDALVILPCGNRLQIGMDVCEVPVGEDLLLVRRHGAVAVADEYVHCGERHRVWGELRADAALSGVAVALPAA